MRTKQTVAPSHIRVRADQVKTGDKILLRGQQWLRVEKVGDPVIHSSYTIYPATVRPDEPDAPTQQLKLYDGRYYSIAR